MPTFYHCERCHHDLSNWIVHQTGPCVCPNCHMPLDPDMVRWAFWEERIRGLSLLFVLLAVPGALIGFFYRSLVLAIVGVALSGLIVLAIAIYLYRVHRAHRPDQDQAQPIVRGRTLFQALAAALLCGGVAFLIALYSPAVSAVVALVAGSTSLLLSMQPRRWNAAGRHDALGRGMTVLGLVLLIWPTYFGIRAGREWLKQ